MSTGKSVNFMQGARQLMDALAHVNDDRRFIPLTRAPRGEWITDAPRRDQEKRGVIRVEPTGRYVNPLAMRARDIDVRDIAHHLSLICRYTGGSPYHYSVAQHSILVMIHLRERGADAALQLAGLLHDAAEYVLNDLASPVKHDPRMEWYRQLDHDVTRLIFCTFGLDPDLLPLTKPADDAVFIAETRTWWKPATDSSPCAPIIRPWLAGAAEHQFLTHFHRLQGILNP